MDYPVTLSYDPSSRRAIGAAGVIPAGTFASLMLAGNSILSQLGFAVSCGIALAAFVMAMFFSPSLTALIGHRAWWPGHADRSEPRPPTLVIVTSCR